MNLRKRDESAFTFLELLLAMAMMVIVASSLYASLRIGLNARESSENIANVSRSAQIAIELLKQEIVTALPPNGILAAEFVGENATGSGGFDSDTLLLYSANHEPKEDETACDIREMEFYLATRDETDETVLVRSITTNLLSPKTTEPIEEVLCRGIKAMNFRYFDGYDWLDEWNSTEHDDTLPAAVEVSIVLEDKDGNNESEENSFVLTQAFVLPCS